MRPIPVLATIAALLALALPAAASAADPLRAQQYGLDMIEADAPHQVTTGSEAVVAVIDILSDVPDGPDGEEQQAPSWAPDLQGDEAAPTGFDFGGVPKPHGTLKSAYLIEGDGEKVEKGQTIVVDGGNVIQEAKGP